VPILHTRAPVSAPALAPAIVGAFYLRKTSGSLAILDAIHRATPQMGNELESPRRGKRRGLGNLREGHFAKVTGRHKRR